MNKESPTSFEIELRKLVLSNCSNKEIGEWATKNFSSFCLPQLNGNVDQAIVDYVIELMELGEAKDDEITRLRLRVIADALINHGRLSKIQAGYEILQKLDAGIGIYQIRKWLEKTLEKQNHQTEEQTEEHNALTSIMNNGFWTIDDEDDSEITKQEMRVWAKCLISEEKNPYEKMLEIIKGNYSLNNASSYFAKGCHFLDRFKDPKFQNERNDNFNSAVKNFTLAIQQWDARALNELGVAYAIRAKDKDILEQVVKKYYRLAIGAFHASLRYTNDNQAHFNLGLAYGFLADLDFDKENLYEESAFHFNKAIESGDNRAFAHLALIYEKLGAFQPSTRKKISKYKAFEAKQKIKNFNLLAIRTATKAVKKGWQHGYGIIGNAYRNLGNLSANKKDRKKNYELAIKFYLKLTSLGINDFQNELNEVLETLNHLKNT